MKLLIVSSIVLFAIGYAWMQTAKNLIDTNIGFVVMAVGFVGTIITATILLHSMRLL